MDREHSETELGRGRRSVWDACRSNLSQNSSAVLVVDRLARGSTQLARSPAGRPGKKDLARSIGASTPPALLALDCLVLQNSYNAISKSQFWPMIGAVGFAAFLAGGALTHHFSGNTDVAPNKSVREEPNHQVSSGRRIHLRKSSVRIGFLVLLLL